MPLEQPPLSLDEQVASLNTRYRHHSAVQILGDCLHDPLIGRAALVSSFGAESVVLLHMISLIDRTTPVLFVDTEMLFAQTLTYQTELANRFGFSDMRRIKPRREDLFAHDTDAMLHQANPDACCDLRKTKPLERALGGFDAWITGRKRHQNAARANLDLFESDSDQRIKINPLADWTTQQVQDYIENNRLPRHPLVAAGFASIGCEPCTTRIGAGESPRAGRWRGREKTECGIHFPTTTTQSEAAI